MISPGAIVRHVGDDKARQAAKELGVGDWGPDGIPDNTFGVCEGFSHVTVGGIELYRCRFQVDDRRTGNIFSHFKGNFYEFELEAL